MNHLLKSILGWGSFIAVSLLMLNAVYLTLGWLPIIILFIMLTVSWTGIEIAIRFKL